MLVGQKLGPFIIDKELGAGAMGAVYRGRHAKTGQLAAIKVMAPGLSNANSTARFVREAKILQQLNHPNIVRFLGASKSDKPFFYAMEYLQGESLDHVMARRGRMTWEEVVALGQQLCAGLQHAHEKGIIHRDLKPSNLMVLPDGTLKLTDFGIAKDMDVTQLTSANCTVGTAAYMSPEQCKGERDLTHKSDLYSMGVLFYELLTGRKPFQADNPMDMFVQHVQGTFVRPAQLFPEIPVWLDTLVCQLLEKKPEHRPFDAALVGNMLSSIQEKVEARQSAGVDAARQRLVDRPRGERRPDDEDREAARTLLGGKTRIRRKRKAVPFYRRVWFQAVGLAALLLGLVGILYLILASPPSPDKLYQQAEKLMSTPDEDAHDRALTGPIREYLAYFGDRPGEQTTRMQQWADQVKLEQCEQVVRNYLRKKNSPIKYQAQSETEAQAFKAADREAEGDLAGAREVWEKIRKDEGNRRWGVLAAWHMQQLDSVGQAREALTRLLTNDIATLGQEPKLEGPQRLAFTGLRYVYLGEILQKPMPGDLARAEKTFQELKDKTADEPSQRVWYLLAAREVKELKDRQSEKRLDAEDHRKELVSQAVAEARSDLMSGENLLQARTLCMHVLALYRQDHALEPLVQEAGDIVKQLQARGISIKL